MEFQHFSQSNKYVQDAAVWANMFQTSNQSAMHTSQKSVTQNCQQTVC